MVMARHWRIGATMSERSPVPTETGRQTGRDFETLFIASPDHAVKPILVRHGRTYSVDGPFDDKFLTTYYDTPDLRLLAAGINLHHRRGGEGEGWCLKLPVIAGVGSQVLAPSDPVLPDQLRGLVGVYIRFGELGPVANLDTARRRYRLLSRPGVELAEVVEDRVVDTAATGQAWEVREIGLRGRGGGARYVRSLRRALVDAGMRECGRGTLARMLDPDHRLRPELPQSTWVGTRAPVLDVIQASIRERVRMLLVCDTRLRLDMPDAVHQMRVALRRLRSELGGFASFLDPSWVGGVAEELTWLAGELGPARELDVLRGDLMAASTRLPAELDPEPLRELLGRRLGADLASALKQVRSALSGDRYLALIDLLVLAAGSLPGGPTSGIPNSRALPRLVWREWKVLRRRVSHLDRGSPSSDYHRVRVAAKRCRYLAEACMPVFGTPAKRFADATQAVHEVLGEHQDALVASGAIRRLAANDAGASAAFLLGLLHADQQERAARARGEFHEGWALVVRQATSGWPRTARG